MAEGDPVSGLDVRVYYDMNHVGSRGVGGANWVEIANQTTAALNCKSEVIDTRNKQKYGWPSKIISGLDWGISCECLYYPGDTVFADLKARWKAKLPIWLKVDESPVGGEVVEGECIVDDRSKEYPVGEAIKLNLQTSGNGELFDSP
mgnify:CR=1 FL=1